MAQNESKHPDRDRNRDRMGEDAPGRYPPDQQFGSRAAEDQELADAAAARDGDPDAVGAELDARRPSGSSPRPANKAPVEGEEGSSSR